MFGVSKDEFNLLKAQVDELRNKNNIIKSTIYYAVLKDDDNKELLISKGCIPFKNGFLLSELKDGIVYIFGSSEAYSSRAFNICKVER